MPVTFSQTIPSNKMIAHLNAWRASPSKNFLVSSEHMSESDTVMSAQSPDSDFKLLTMSTDATIRFWSVQEKRSQSPSEKKRGDARSLFNVGIR